MMLAETTPFIQSPLAVTLIGVACATMVTLMASAVKVLIQLARMEALMKNVVEDITALKVDPDVMRWSNYGRMMQSPIGGQHQSGGTP